MNPTYLHQGSFANGQLPAWLLTAAIAVAGLLFARQHIADWLLKLYRYFIQNLSS